jgi:hypothetical protein
VEQGVLELLVHLMEDLAAEETLALHLVLLQEVLEPQTLAEAVEEVEKQQVGQADLVWLLLDIQKHL